MEFTCFLRAFFAVYMYMFLIFIFAESHVVTE